MSTPAIAYLAIQYVQKRLVDGSTGFNSLIKQTAQTYNINPFTLDTSSQPPSLYLGRYTAADLSKSGNTGGITSNFPIAILSVSKADSIGQENLRLTPSTFSGTVIVSLDFYVSYPVSVDPPDGNAMFYAVTDALYGALNTRDSYNVVPQGLIYNNEILAEQGKMEWDGSRWIQFIPCAISFIVVG